jgi:predicted metal-dependent peptidase
MSQRPHQQAREDEAINQRIARGLRRVTGPFPHLAGLAAAMRVSLDDSVPTMGVFASGRLVANRAFTARLADKDLDFVLAHELMHLALRTHDRAVGASHIEYNYAHDYIINDTLRHELGMPIPAGGLDMHGARERTAEDIVLEMRRKAKNETRSRVWEGQVVTIEVVMSGGDQGGAGDVLDEARERRMFPGDTGDQAKQIRAVRDLAIKGAALAQALGLLKNRGMQPGDSTQQVRALRGIYRVPWQIAVQRWLEGAAPAERTYTRASRRGAERTDVVLPGRRRETQMLNVILDTSGSMTGDMPFALGAIADFCEAAGIDEIRVVQCDTVVTADDTLSATELAAFDVKGYGGSDLTPAFETLALDPRVTAVVVITDGEITYPQSHVPFSVLWAVPGDTTSFAPPYGRVVTMPREGST